MIKLENILFADDVEEFNRDSLIDRIKDLEIESDKIIYVKKHNISLSTKYLYGVYALRTLNQLKVIKNIPPYTMLFLEK